MMENSTIGLGSENDSTCVFEGTEGVEEDLEFLKKKQVIQWVAYRVIAPAIVGIGLLGNVLNLIVLTRPGLKQVITYTYLIGLACSDIGVLLCAVPMLMRQTRLERENSYGWTFFYSHLEYPLANFFMASSIWIVICLTVDRFASVCLPTVFKSMHTRAKSLRAIFLCYALAILISFPLSLINKICPMPPNDTLGGKDGIELFRFTENFRVTSSMVWRIYIYSAEVIVRFGPAAVMATLNFLIIWRFRQITERRKNMLTGEGNDENSTTNDQLLLRGEKISKKIYKEEKRLVTLLSAIVLLFFVTTTPVAILGISYSQKLDRNLYFQIFRAVANLLELCNFALNFYVYFLCSKEFRKKFLSFFTVLLPRQAKANFQSIALPPENRRPSPAPPQEL